MNYKPIAGAILSTFYFFSNALAVYASETNFWEERRVQKNQQIAQRSGGLGATNKGEESETASVLLAQLPGARTVRLDGANVNAHAFDVPPITVNGIPKTDLNAAQTALARDGSADWLDPIVNPYGTLREIHLSKKEDSPLVIHIQDVHGYVDAQKNIAGMIDGLSKYRGVNLIGMEAAEGAFALEDLRRFPDRDIKERVTDWAIKKDLIGGAEKSGIMAEKSLTLWGVENTPLYQSNVQAVQDSLARRPEALKFHGELVKDLARLKATVYSEPLKKYDENLTAYRDQRRGLGDFIRALAEQNAGGEKDLSKGYPNTALILNALTQESRLDFKQVERERVRLVELLAARLDEKTLNGLVKESMAYRGGRITYGRYYAYVQELCRQAKINLSKFPGLTDYIAYVGHSEKINRDHLLSEMEKLEEAVATRLARTDMERNVLALSRDSSLMGNLINNAMTPEEWARYLKRQGEMGQLEDRLKTCAHQAGLSFETKFPQDFAGFVTPFEEFCRLAVARDEAMANGLFAKMEKDQIKAAMLVTGGFHTAGLSEEIKRRGGSYVVLTPRVEIVKSDKIYLDAFAHDPVPLEKLFDGEKISILTARTTAASAQGNQAVGKPTASSAIQFAMLLESVKKGLAEGKPIFQIQSVIEAELKSLNAKLNLEIGKGGYLTVSLAGVIYKATFKANGEYVIVPATKIRNFIVAFVIPIAETIIYGLLTPILVQILTLDPTGIGWAIGFLAPTIIGFLSAITHFVLWNLQGKEPTLRDFFIWWGQGTLFSLPFTLFPSMDWNGAFFASWLPHALLNPAVVYGTTERLGDKYRLPWLKTLKPASSLVLPAPSAPRRNISNIIHDGFPSILLPLLRAPPASLPSETITTPNPTLEEISRQLKEFGNPSKYYDFSRFLSPADLTDESDITKVFPQTMTFGIEIEFQLNKQSGPAEDVLGAVDAILSRHGWPPLEDYSRNFKEATSVVLKNTRTDWDRLKAVLKDLQDDPLSHGLYSVHMHIGNREMNQGAVRAKKEQVGRVGKAFEAMWRALSGRRYSRPGGNISPMKPGALLGDKSLFIHESIINLSGRYPTIEVKIISGLLNEKGHLPVDDLEDHLWFVFALFTAATHPDRRLPLVQMGRPVVAGEKPSSQQIKAFLDQVFGDWDPHGRRLAEAKFNALASEEAGLTSGEIEQRQKEIKQIYRKAGLVQVYDLHDAAEGNIDFDIIEHLLQPEKLKSVAEDLVRSGATNEQALAFFPAEMYVPLLEALAQARRELGEEGVPDREDFTKLFDEIMNSFPSRNPRAEFERYIRQTQPSGYERVSSTFNRYLSNRTSINELRNEFLQVRLTASNPRDLPSRLFPAHSMGNYFRTSLIRPQHGEMSIRYLLGYGYSKRSITGISMLVFSLMVNLLNLALYIPNLISTTVYLETIIWAFGSAVVGIFGLLGYKQILRSIGLGRWAGKTRTTPNVAEVEHVIRRLFPSHQGDIKKIALVSRIVEDDTVVALGAYRLSDDGKTLTLIPSPGRGRDQFVKNAHFDPVTGTLFMLETVALSPDPVIGIAVAPEIGKKEFFRWNFQTPLLNNARAAEFFGNLYEILYLLNLPLPRLSDSTEKKGGTIGANLAVLALSLVAHLWNPPAIESPTTTLPQTELKQEVSNPAISSDKSDGAYIDALFDSIKKSQGLKGTFENTNGLIEVLKSLNGVNSIEELRGKTTIFIPSYWPIRLTDTLGSWNILKFIGFNSVGGAAIEALFYLIGATLIGNLLIPSGELGLQAMIPLFFDVTGTAFLVMFIVDFFIHFFGGVGQVNGQPSVTFWKDGFLRTAKEALKATFTATNNAYMLPLVILGLMLMPIAPMGALAMFVFGFVLGAYKHAMANYKIEMSAQVSTPADGVTVFSTPITEKGTVASLPTTSLLEMLNFAFAGGPARNQYDGISRAIHRVTVTRQGLFAANDISLVSATLNENSATWIAQQALVNRGERGQDEMQELMIFLNMVVFFSNHLITMANQEPDGPIVIEVASPESLKESPAAQMALAAVLMAHSEVASLQSRPLALVARGEGAESWGSQDQVQSAALEALQKYSPATAQGLSQEMNANNVTIVLASGQLLTEGETNFQYNLAKILSQTYTNNNYNSALVLGNEAHFNTDGVTAIMKNYFTLAEQLSNSMKGMILFLTSA